jgi:FkbM family methyltransferase
MAAVFREEHEQALLASYLPVKGFFVEVGAYQPVAFSQTWELEQRGWDGLLIDPIPAHAQNLRRERRARVFEVACGRPEQHGLTMPMYTAGGLSSFHRAHGPTIEVQVVTLDSVLMDASVQHIDFLSVDVEGSELDVLRGFLFERYRPRLILLEDFAEGLEKHRFMRARGYKRVRRTGNNSWYIPREISFPITWFGKWQLLRKYYLSIPIRWLKRHIVRLRRLAVSSSRLRARGTHANALYAGSSPTCRRRPAFSSCRRRRHCTCADDMGRPSGYRYMISTPTNS